MSLHNAVCIDLELDMLFQSRHTFKLVGENERVFGNSDPVLCETQYNRKQVHIFAGETGDFIALYILYVFCVVTKIWRNHNREKLG